MVQPARTTKEQKAFKRSGGAFAAGPELMNSLLL
jgi:hypothetical protein